MVITVGRQYGSGGREIGTALANKLVKSLLQASCLRPTDPCPHYQLDGPGATGNGTVGRLQAMGDLRQLCIQLELQSDLWQIHSSTEFNKNPPEQYTAS